MPCGAIGKWWGVPDREIQRKMLLTGKDIPRKPYPNVDGIKLVMKLYHSPEMQKRKAEDFYDDSLMKELDKSGFIDKLYTRRQQVGQHPRDRPGCPASVTTGSISRTPTT